jgi:hypothetical protein
MAGNTLPLSQLWEGWGWLNLLQLKLD